jgi:hypothetical protein
MMSSSECGEFGVDWKPKLDKPNYRNPNVHRWMFAHSQQISVPLRPTRHSQRHSFLKCKLTAKLIRLTIYCAREHDGVMEAQG